MYRKAVGVNHEPMDVDCIAVNGDNAFAGSWVIDVGQEAVDRGNVIAGTHVVDNGKVLDGDAQAKG